METTTASQAFVDQLIARNFVELARVFAPDAVARFLLPGGPQEAVGADAIAGRFEGWFGDATDFTVVATRNQKVGGRSLLQWQFRLRREGRPPEVIEQVAFVDAGPRGVYRLDLVCSGFLPDADPVLSCDVPHKTSL